MARCKYCRLTYERKRMSQSCCESIECAIKAGQARKAKEAAKQAKDERREIRARKEALKPMQYWLKRAEKACNAFIRERDKAELCISCGTWDTTEWHAGHWISVGASSALRYDPANIHKQCHQCNWHKGGNSTDYEARLPARIGQEEFERVKFAKRERKWTREELAAIEADAKRKLKDLKNE